MQEGEGHSQLCLDRLQLEAIHKVKALFHLFTHLHTHFLPTLDLNIKDMGDEKVQREGRIQLWQPHLPECDRPTPSYLSHSIMVLSFQIVTPSLHTHTHTPLPLQLGLTLKHQLRTALLFALLFPGPLQPKPGLLWMAGIWRTVRSGSDPFCPCTHLTTGPPYAA